MDGFKDSTKMKYMMGGEVSAYKTGGTVKKAMGGACAPVKKAMGGACGPMKKATGGTVKKAMGGACSPMKKATGGTVKMSEGGTYNEKGKRATMAEIAAEDRRMANRKPPVEGVSSRPTDSSGRRATDADLGMTRAAKKGVPAYSGKPMIRRSKGGLTAMPKGKC